MPLTRRCRQSRSPGVIRHASTRSAATLRHVAVAMPRTEMSKPDAMHHDAPARHARHRRDAARYAATARHCRQQRVSVVEDKPPANATAKTPRHSTAR